MRDTTDLPARKTVWSLLAALVLLSACGADESSPATEAPAEPPATEGEDTNLTTEDTPEPVDYLNIVSSPNRPEADLADDLARKPVRVLEFFQARPGMAIMELEAGSGYYTELLSYVAGPEGKVIMQNPQGFDAFLGDSLDKRLGNDRLPNVTVSRTQFDNLEADDASIDLVTWVLGPHELWFTMEDGTGFGDVETTYREINRVLKPGGAFVVLDHAAPAGAPPETGGTTHRIDPEIINDLAEQAGLIKEAESDALANPDDDYSKMVFDPSVRRKTDRFLIRYRKPE